MTYYTIYKTTNLINNKIYIGKHKTDDLNDGYLGSGNLIKEAVKNFKKENFKKEILYVYDNQVEMDEKEKELVDADFILDENNYNICKGGSGVFDKDHEDSQKYIEKANAVLRKNYGDNYIEVLQKKATEQSAKKHKEKFGVDEEYTKMRRMWAEKNRQFANTPEAKEKKRQTYKEKCIGQGKNNSQYGTMWITNGTKNMKIKKTESIPSGFTKGRFIAKHSISTK